MIKDNRSFTLTRSSAAISSSVRSSDPSFRAILLLLTITKSTGDSDIKRKASPIPSSSSKRAKTS